MTLAELVEKHGLFRSGSYYISSTEDIVVTHNYNVPPRRQLTVRIVDDEWVYDCSIAAADELLIRFMRSQ